MSDHPNKPIELDYAPKGRIRPLLDWKNLLTCLVILLLGGVAGAGIGWATSPAIRYEARGLFRIKVRSPLNVAQKAIDNERAQYAATPISVLNDPEVVKEAIRQRGPSATSLIQTPEQFNRRVNIAPLGELVVVKIEDASQEDAELLLKPYCLAALDRIPPSLSGHVAVLQTSDPISPPEDFRVRFALSGAVLGAGLALIARVARRPPPALRVIPVDETTFSQTEKSR